MRSKMAMSSSSILVFFFTCLCCGFFIQTDAQQAGNASDVEESRSGGWTRKLVANDHVIQQLGDKLINIKRKIRAKTTGSQRIYREIETTVSRLEGTGCGYHEFQCGTYQHHGSQCISELLVCDGVKDCINGQDEDARYCDVSEIRPGIRFSGYFTEGKCERGTRDVYHCWMLLTEARRSKVYPSMMFLKMKSECSVTAGSLPGVGKTKTIKYSPSGSYQIANRRWRSGEGDYSSDCYFTDNTFRAMYCQSMQGDTDCGNNLVIYRDD